MVERGCCWVEDVGDSGDVVAGGSVGVDGCSGVVGQGCS